MPTKVADYFRVLALGTNSSRDNTAKCAPKAVGDLRKMVGIFSALAKELECDFASLFGTIPAPSLTKDGVNPDGAGNAAIAQILSQKIAAIAP